jgi:leucyl aminopeptidase
MNVKLSGTSDYKVDVSVICLMYEDSSFDLLNLNKTEEAYLKQSISNKKKIISINQYYRWIFFKIIEKDNKLNENAEKIRRSASDIFQILKEEKVYQIQIINLTENKDWSLSCSEGLLLSQYQFKKYLTKNETNNFELEHIYFYDYNDNDKLKALKELIKAVFFTRDLINEPANVLNSIYLAKQATLLAEQCNLNIKVYNKAEIEELKMGGLLAVNKGSVDPPVFINLEYKPLNAKNNKPYILVGKGITFDSGGLNIKPGDSMDGMKSDMSGAAAVLGILMASASNKIPLHIIGLIPATDNRPGFNAFAPGDIIHMMDGTTVEMLNSDAEGRMILADALHYAKQFDPQLVIDIATLTGSASAAVGRNATVAFVKTDEDIYKKLEEAAFETWERIVRFPLWDDYGEMLKSKIADIKNIGNKYAGAITAAKFLEHFTSYQWIHLDIAGPAFLNEKDSYRGIGGTGVTVRLIYRLFEKL